MLFNPIQCNLDGSDGQRLSRREEGRPEPDAVDVIEVTYNHCLSDKSMMNLAERAVLYPAVMLSGGSRVMLRELC